MHLEHVRSTTSPSKATSRQSGHKQGTSRSALPARRNQRVSGSCSFWNARGPLEDHAVHVPAVAGAVRRGLLRHLASPPPGFGHVPHPLAVAEHDAAPAVRRRLPARTGAVQVDVGVAGAVRVPALGAPTLLAVTAPRVPLQPPEPKLPLATTASRTKHSASRIEPRHSRSTGRIIGVIRPFASHPVSPTATVSAPGSGYVRSAAVRAGVPGHPAAGATTAPRRRSGRRHVAL